MEGLPGGTWLLVQQVCVCVGGCRSPGSLLNCVIYYNPPGEAPLPPSPGAPAQGGSLPLRAESLPGHFGSPAPLQAAVLGRGDLRVPPLPIPVLLEQGQKSQKGQACYPFIFT